MKEYRLSNYLRELDYQVVHMDQGAAYCPEFRATRMMHDFPSRRLQIGRAIYHGELTPSDYSARILNQCILSRQGERWQNFGEDPEDFTDCVLLTRHMLQEKGLNEDVKRLLQASIEENDGHILPVEKNAAFWKQTMPLHDGSHTVLYLDDATSAIDELQTGRLAGFFAQAGLSFHSEIGPFWGGWEYFAHGLLEEGYEHARKSIADFAALNIRKIVTLSAQSEYLWKVFYPKLGLSHPFEVVGILDLVHGLNVPQKSYLFGGSFWTRYLMAGEKINALVPNSHEILLNRAEEFTPVYEADYRVNQVNIWQKPVCAEYLAIGIDETLSKAIFEDAYDDIARTPHRCIVTFDAWAYQVLKKNKPGENVRYFLEFLP